MQKKLASKELPGSRHMAKHKAICEDPGRTVNRVLFKTEFLPEKRLLSFQNLYCLFLLTYETGHKSKTVNTRSWAVN